MNDPFFWMETIICVRFFSYRLLGKITDVLYSGFLEDWQLHRTEKRDCFYGCHCSSGHVLSGCFTTEWGALQSDPKSQRHIDWIWSGGKQTVKSKVPVVCMDGSCCLPGSMLCICGWDSFIHLLGFLVLTRQVQEGQPGWTGSFD